MINLPTIWKKWNPEICDRDVYRNYRDTVENPDFEIINRIGSDSADAEVYHIKNPDNISFALKIMPRTDNDSEQKNRKEIEIAIAAATKLPKYFPKTFGHGIANNYKRISNTLLFKKAEEYSCYNSLLNQLKSKRHRLEFSQSYREGIPLSELIDKYDLQPCENNVVTITSDYLISELANGDLGNFIKQQSIRIHEWKLILFDIVTGIYYLAKKLKKAHTDLHLGNILILLPTDNCSITALLHDFGRTIDTEKEHPETYLTGLLSFCKEFLEASKRTDLIIPKKIINTIFKINEFINEIVMNKSSILSMNQIYSTYKYVLQLIKNISEIDKIVKRRNKSRKYKSRPRSKSKRRAYSK